MQAFASTGICVSKKKLSLDLRINVHRASLRRMDVEIINRSREKILKKEGARLPFLGKILE